MVCSVSASLQAQLVSHLRNIVNNYLYGFLPSMLSQYTYTNTAQDMLITTRYTIQSRTV